MKNKGADPKLWEHPSTRTSTDGKPFYCRYCYAPYSQFYYGTSKCDGKSCEIETIDEAMKRKKK